MQKDENEIEESTKNDIPIKGSEENNFEIEDIEKNNSEIKSICKYCLQPIKSGAKICHNCGKHQSKLSRVPYYFATLAIPLAVVVFAGLQVWVNILQYDEAKAKRVEAEQVLDQAEQVLEDATNQSKKIRKKAEATLSVAKEISAVAKEEANKVLSMARVELKTAITETDEIKKTFDEAAKDVAEKQKDSYKRISLAETKYNQLKSEYEVLKNNVSAELTILKERNQLTSLTDKAINEGDRDSLDKLDKIVSDESMSEDRKSMALAEILRIKSHYSSGTRLNDLHIKIEQPDGSVLENEDLPTDTLILGLLKSPSWVVRGGSACFLATRKEKGVPEALLQSIESEKKLDVLRESIKSFCKVTGLQSRDIFNSDYIPDWWEENKERVMSELSEKQ